MNIVFFGTSAFAAYVLRHLIAKKEEIVAIVTRPDRPKGRSLQMSFSPVKEVTLSHPFTLFQPEKASTEEFIHTLSDFKPDLFVVVAYGEIMKENLLKCPKLGAINIHASLLPKFRGAAPIQRALIEGEAETGITIIEMVQKMDAGNMLFKNKIAIPPEMNFDELSLALADLACEAIDKVIGDFKANSVESVPQDHAQVTFAAKIVPEDEVIHWDRSAEQIHNQVRGLSPRPGAWSYLTLNHQKKRLKILKSRADPTQMPLPGVVFKTAGGEWAVACGTGALILLDVQLEGKKKMGADEFFRGYPGQNFTLSN